MTNPSIRPFFIVGVHRSGTTLLRYMLNSSPRIYVSPESDFIPRFFLRNPPAELSNRRIADILHTIFTSYRFVGEWEGDPPDAGAFAEALPRRTPQAFLDALYSAYAQQHSAVRWADKTPIYTSYIDLIHRIFPEAQFVHIIRDGRDATLSMLEKWEQRELHIDVYFSARNWVRRIRRARVSGARLGTDLYYEIRYEHLVQDPEPELRRLCDFLEEPFFPIMAQPHLLARSHIAPDGFHAPIRQPPNPKRVGRWHREMTLADQRLFQRVAGELLKELGYPVVDLRSMSLKERARFLALATKYETLQAGRRVLQALGVFPPI
jgi:hypothetical protein